MSEASTGWSRPPNWQTSSGALKKITQRSRLLGTGKRVAL
jgi:hypothetical protein